MNLKCYNFLWSLLPIINNDVHDFIILLASYIIDLKSANRDDNKRTTVNNLRYVIRFFVHLRKANK
jgi:hypothetical protein